MSIKANVSYNKPTGNYDGFVNYGEGVVPPDEEAIAKEALVLMLVSLSG